MKRSKQAGELTQAQREKRMIELDEKGFEQIEARAIIEGKLTEEDVKFLDEHPVVVGTTYRKARGRKNTPLTEVDIHRGRVDKATTRRGVLETVDTELGYFVIDKEKTLQYEKDADKHKKDLQKAEEIRNSQKVGDLSKLLQGRSVEDTVEETTTEETTKEEGDSLHWKEAVKLIKEAESIDEVREIAAKSNGKSVDNAVEERIKELKEQD